MADIERLRRVLAHIEQHPELWRQETWVSETACGTAYCFAGWTLALEGIQMVVDEDGVYVDDRELPQPWLDRLRALRLGYLYGDWHRAAVSDVAALVLGLYSEDGRLTNDKWALFGACVTLDNLREMIDRLERGQSAIRGGIHVRARTTDPQEAARGGVAHTGGVAD